jgi:hypothetical protein
MEIYLAVMSHSIELYSVMMSCNGPIFSHNVMFISDYNDVTFNGTIFSNDVTLNGTILSHGAMLNGIIFSHSVTFIGDIFSSDVTLN